MRKDTKRRKVAVSGSGPFSPRRNRRISSAVGRSSGEPICEPGGDLERDFGGKWKRRWRATYSKKPRVIWGSNSPGIKRSNPRPEMAWLQFEDDDVSMTASLPFFYFSIFFSRF